MQPILPTRANPAQTHWYDRLLKAAALIDPCSYRDVSLALIAVDASLQEVGMLAAAIRECRGAESHAYFLGEYGELIDDVIDDALQRQEGR